MKVSRPRARFQWLPVLGLVSGISLVALGVVVLRWREPAGHAPRPTDPTTERLRALGYVGYVHDDPDPERDGVMLHDPARAQSGINVYCSAHGTEVSFVDMQGSILHRLVIPAPDDDKADCLLEPYDAASFLGLNAPRLTRLDWNSSRLWVSSDGHHHDVAVDAEGRVYTLSALRSWLAHDSRRLPVQDHTVTVLNRDGRVERTIPLLPLFADRIPAERLARMVELLAELRSSSPEYHQASDVLHPNTIELLARDLPVAPAGSALLCVRELDLVAIVDLQAERLLWTWGPGVLERPHHPSLLDDGTLLVFDNGTTRGFSRVIQLDPATRRILWQYEGDPPETFFSDVRGSAQALQNGNVLVTESMRGRVFEVTRAGDVVWEFLNPERGPTGERKQIYRMFRISAAQFAEWKQRGQATGQARNASGHPTSSPDPPRSSGEGERVGSDDPG